MQNTIRTSTQILCIAALCAVSHAQPGVFPPDVPPPPGSLKGLAVPLPPNLSDFVTDTKTAIVLGKALFWDQQAGSDGLACASCHFHAGADNRAKNQLDPDLRNTTASLQNIWNLTASNRFLHTAPPGGGPNYTLTAADFPFHQLANPLDRNSLVVFDTNDVVSSQGVFRADFEHLNVDSPKNRDRKLEVCGAALSTTFSVEKINVRQVEPRNTPTVINAIFNFRNFWDGRANNIFNGRNPFGLRDPSAGIDPLNSVLVADGAGKLTPYPVVLPDASLASQAVGPPGSDLEMSCRGRVFEEIGQKMMASQPLAGQVVDPTDSVLGPYANRPAGNSQSANHTGLNTTYEALVRKAFASKFWNSTRLSADGYRQIEKNFSLFWGLSIMLYESTLVSDDTPFDRYIGGNPAAMTNQQVTGFVQVFLGKGGCIFCHKGPEFTGAASTLRNLKDLGAQVEHMIMGDGTVALYDSGFYNIGVRPPGNDIGVGGLDPWNVPLSWSREAKLVANAFAMGNLFNISPDAFNVFTCNFQVDPCFPVSGDERDAIDGSFKVPTLRNVELTGPYFHNGGMATLEQVIDFYNRGGDGAGTDFANTTGYGPNPTNRAPAILPLNLTAADKANLVAFLTALTDDRVRWEKAPFDHPSLTVPNGEAGNEMKVTQDGKTGYASDTPMVLPAVGAAGRAALKLPPLQPFSAGLH